jgi:membrane-associated phospholipid phosphatase
VLLYTFFYIETHALDSLFVAQPMDRVFIAFDYALFGYHPSRGLVQRLPYLPVSELMYFAYFTYYIMIPGVGLALYVRCRRRFYEYVAVISFVFYVCYLTYIFFPVLGPHTLEPTGSTDALTLGPRIVPPHLASGFFFRTVRFVYKTFEPSGGAAFPSSHVAVAFATVYYTWRYVRRVRWMHLVDVLLLTVSTVYCGYHYAADVFAGALTAAAFVPLAVRLYPKLERPEGAGPAGTTPADADPGRQDASVTRGL